MSSRYRGRPSKYRKSLQKNSYWQEVRRKIKIRDDHKCICCDSKLFLEVHHITYYVNKKSIIGIELEYLEWLGTVCNRCHGKIHKNIKHLLNPKNYYKVNANHFKKYHGNNFKKFSHRK